jgi:hypothetical protein
MAEKKPSHVDQLAAENAAFERSLGAPPAPIAPEGTDSSVLEENAHLRAENARMRERLAIKGEGPLVRADLIHDIHTTPLSDPAFQSGGRFFREPHQQQHAAVVSRACGTGAILLCVIDTKSRGRLRAIKAELPSTVPATLGPAVRINLHAQDEVDRELLGALDPQLARAIVEMDRGTYRQELSSYSYEHVATTHHELFGKGKRGHHNRMVRLHMPIGRMAGLIEPELRQLSSYFEWLEPGATELPKAWLEACSTPDVGPVYEAPATFTRAHPFARPDDAFEPRRDVPRDHEGAPLRDHPGRY